MHVAASNGEAKFWLEPVVALAYNHRLSQRQLKELQRVIEDREDEIKDSWKKHFKSRSR